MLIGHGKERGLQSAARGTGEESANRPPASESSDALRTGTLQCWLLVDGCSMFDVRCSMFAPRPLTTDHRPPPTLLSLPPAARTGATSPPLHFCEVSTHSPARTFLTTDH